MADITSYAISIELKVQDHLKAALEDNIKLASKLTGVLDEMNFGKKLSENMESISDSFKAVNVDADKIKSGLEDIGVPIEELGDKADKFKKHIEGIDFGDFEDDAFGAERFFDSILRSTSTVEEALVRGRKHILEHNKVVQMGIVLYDETKQAMGGVVKGAADILGLGNAWDYVVGKWKKGKEVILKLSSLAAGKEINLVKRYLNMLVLRRLEEGLQAKHRRVADGDNVKGTMKQIEKGEKFLKLAEKMGKIKRTTTGAETAAGASKAAGGGGGGLNGIMGMFGGGGGGGAAATAGMRGMSTAMAGISAAAAVAAIAIAAVVAAVIVAVVIVKAAIEMAKLASKALEEFHTVNFKAAGGAKMLAMNTELVAQKHGVLREEALAATKALAEVGFTSNVIRQDMDNLSGFVADFTRVTGVSSEVGAKFTRMFDVAGMSIGDAKESMGAMTAAMEQYGLTSQDVTSLMEGFNNSLQTMKSFHSDKTIKAYASALAIFGSAAKQAGVPVETAAQFMEALTKQVDQFILLTDGKSFADPIQGAAAAINKVEDIEAKIANVPAHMKGKMGQVYMDMYNLDANMYQMLLKTGDMYDEFLVKQKSLGTKEVMGREQWLATMEKGNEYAKNMAKMSEESNNNMTRMMDQIKDQVLSILAAIGIKLMPIFIGISKIILKVVGFVHGALGPILKFLGLGDGLGDLDVSGIEKEFGAAAQSMKGFSNDIKAMAGFKAKQLSIDAAVTETKRQAKMGIIDLSYNKMLEDRQNALDKEIEAYQSKKDEELIKSAGIGFKQNIVPSINEFKSGIKSSIDDAAEGLKSSGLRNGDNWDRVDKHLERKAANDNTIYDANDAANKALEGKAEPEKVKEVELSAAIIQKVTDKFDSMYAMNLRNLKGGSATSEEAASQAAFDYRDKWAGDLIDKGDVEQLKALDGILKSLQENAKHNKRTSYAVRNSGPQEAMGN